MGFIKGEIVLSRKGNDTGKLFCVVDTQEGFAMVADGKGRKLAAPKRKNVKHLIGVGTSAHPAILGLQRGESISDRALRSALAAFRDSEQTEMEVNQFV